jgi:threonyl-tRNA synthetase
MVEYTVMKGDNMNNEQLYAMRHSLAHIMADAVCHLWPEVKLGVGPVIEDGFYYDIDLGGTKISEDDFKKIEKEMHHIINQKQDFVRSEKDIDEAIKWAQDAKQPYKIELLNDLKRAGTTVAKDLDASTMGVATDEDDAKITTVSFYTNGDFTDLCRGPHVTNTSDVGAFKLMRIAGAYWRGNEKNPQMQRLYGVAFATKEELDAYLLRLEEAKRRDHRKLGRELDLFVISDLVGAGLPLWTPRGTVLREELARYSNEMREKAGYQKVAIPHITKTDLYKTSGHWEKFGDELFLVKSQETDDEFVMKPMNCPHHTQIYASRPRSYKDLPLKYLETTMVYRDEKSGELNGLSRVRSITQDDSHVFCREDQIEQIFGELIEMAKEMYRAFDMKLSLRLSFRDDIGKYIGSDEQWSAAQDAIQKMAGKFEMKYEIGLGEAAMYGPKMDFMAEDAIGRKWQLATVQLDYAQPERFGLEYTAEGGEIRRPVMIHCALLGSLERFLSVYIEHTDGKFPVWCAPEQLRVILVNDSEQVLELARKIRELAEENGVRITTDDSSNSVGKKIRNAETSKVPYSVVLGEKEVASGQLPLRIRTDLLVDETIEHIYAPEQLIKSIANEARGRVSKSSL